MTDRQKEPRTAIVLGKKIFTFLLAALLCSVPLCRSVYAAETDSTQAAPQPEEGTDSGWSFGSMWESITNAIRRLFATVEGAVSALSQMSEQVSSFSDTIDGMIASMAGETENGQAVTVGGYAVTEVIGTIRYILGDPVFYTIYLFILFGVLFTIYKLVMVIIDHVRGITSLVGSLGGRQGVIDKVKNFFTGFLGG